MTSKKQQTEKLGPPSLTRRQPALREHQNSTQPCRSILVDADDVDFVPGIRNNENGQMRSDQLGSATNCFCINDDYKDRNHAAAFRPNAMENKNDVVETVEAIPFRRSRNLIKRQSYHDIAHVNTSPTPCGSEENRVTQKRKNSDKVGRLRFLLTNEDSDYIREVLMKGTAAGDVGKELKSLTDIMENDKDEEEAKMFLDELEAKKERSCPPKYQSNSRVRQDPFICDISRLEGPICNYDYNDYRIQDFDTPTEYLVDIRESWDQILPEFHLEDLSLVG